MAKMQTLQDISVTLSSEIDNTINHQEFDIDQFLNISDGLESVIEVLHAAAVKLKEADNVVKSGEDNVVSDDGRVELSRRDAVNIGTIYRSVLQSLNSI